VILIFTGKRLLFLASFGVEHFICFLLLFIFKPRGFLFVLFPLFDLFVLFSSFIFFCFFYFFCFYFLRRGEGS